MRNSAFLTIGLAAMLIVAVVGSWYFYSESSGLRIEPPEAPIGEPLLVTIGFGDIETAIPAVGRVQYAELAAVGVHEPGRLAEIYVEVGDAVDEGQLLALIERSNRPRFVEVPAPVAGTVMLINLREGQPLDPADDDVTILQIADTTRWVVVAEVYEPDIAALGRDTDVVFTTVPAGEREWTGTISRIEPRALSPGSQASFDVVIDVDPPFAGLRADSTADIFFVNRLAQNVLIVPLGALARVGGEQEPDRVTARVVLADGTTATREIITGVRDRINAEVIAGLERGDRVVAGSELVEIEYEPFPFEPPAEFRRAR